ncbi:MAG TPA: hypothetical protein VJS42_03730 [Steroidobacteraceae bacterium]|nr:hypothetical protein [Steroidobacteraceae bacterium]
MNVEAAARADDGAARVQAVIGQFTLAIYVCTEVGEGFASGIQDADAGVGGKLEVDAANRLHHSLHRGIW